MPCACAVTTRLWVLQLLRDILSAAGLLCDKAAVFRDTIKWTSCIFQFVIKHHPINRRNIICLTDHVVKWATKVPTINKQWPYCGLQTTGFSTHWHIWIVFSFYCYQPWFILSDCSPIPQKWSRACCPERSTRKQVSQCECVHVKCISHGDPST